MITYLPCKSEEGDISCRSLFGGAPKLWNKQSGVLWSIKAD